MLPQATIPGPPDNYRTTAGFWYYGWPLSKEDVERILNQLRGYAIDMSGTPIDFLVGDLLFLLDKRLHYEFHVVYVKSDGSPQNSRPFPEPFLPYAPGPCFLVLFSPIIRLFDQRPTQEQIDTLVRDCFQGEEPRWCEDARKREDWGSYGISDD
ncbi:hypothetical protein K523DRAFT_411821 [Schizophyllum commune Tattone D]|nr:hypothetical protein K523DRAFT_411821 [Schizophyllum commune Tattone D]